MVSKIRIRPHKLAFVLLGLSSLILMLFNSCQGPLGVVGMSKGFKSSLQQCSAKPGLVSKLSLSLDEKQRILKSQPSVFDEGKLQLGSAALPEGVSGKASSSASETLPAGTSLAVLIDNECLESLKDNAEATEFSGEVALNRMNLEEMKLQTYSYQLDQDWLIADFEEKLNRDVCVKGVTYNKTYSLTAFSANGRLNDVYQNKQHHFDAVKASSSFLQFYDENNGMALSGSPILVAVLDTGIDWTHPDLAANIWKYQINGNSFWGLNAPTLGTGVVDYNPVDDSSVGHGTHVAGIISAVSGNTDGVAGLMPFRSKIMAIKVFKLVSYPDGSAHLETTTEIVSNAIRWAADRGAHVINLSLARLENVNPSVPGSGTDANYEDALSYALNAGSFVVSAIGNSTSTYTAQELNSTFTSLPARYAKDYQGMMSVGSINVGDGSRSYFSHWGTEYVEIGAPGTQSNGVNSPAGIFSTLPTWVGSRTGYGALQGTSMSAPMVSAAAALTIGMIREAYGMVPNPAEVERLISLSAEKSTMLTSYFKDGNSLDFQSLVDQIQTDYPLTKGVGGQQTDLSSISCP